MIPICTRCHTEMRCSKTGAYWVTHTFDSVGDRGAYQVYQADQFACPQCRNSILTGFGKTPIYTHPTAEDMASIQSEPGSVVIHEKRRTERDERITKCPNCGGDLKSYHSPGITRRVCVHQCTGYDVVQEIRHGGKP